MATDTRPPWVGVLVFLDLGYASGKDPVLFRAPHYDGPLLPSALTRLLTCDFQDGRFEVTTAQDTDVLKGLAFARPGPPDP